MSLSKMSAALKPGHGQGQNSSSSDAQPQLDEAPKQINKTSKKWKITLMFGLAIPVFLETLDYTVVATAQPHIASAFNRLDLQSYIGTVYLLTATVFLPLFGSLADTYGRYLALQYSLVFFIIGSAISTGSQNMPMMLAGRGIAGIGAAGLLALVRIILADSRSLDDNNWQVTIMFVLYSVGYCVGPLIGGALVEVSFRWIFAINLPCCALAMVICFFLLRNKVKAGQTTNRLPSSLAEKETQIQKFLRVDWIGAFFFISGGILLLLALNWGSTQEWKSAKVIVSFILSGLLLIACILWEYALERQETAATPSSLPVLRAEPMLPLDIFRSYDVCSVQFASFVSGMVMLVMFYFVAIFMTIVTGLSAKNSGVQLLYFAPGIGVGSSISIQIIKYFRQPKYPIVFGGLLLPIALGLISMAMNHNNRVQIGGFLALAGVGVGLSLGPLAIQARFSQPDDRLAVVASLTLFFRSLGGTVGLAQCATVLNAKVKSYVTSLVASGKLSAASAAALASASSTNSIQSINDLPPELQTIVRDAFRSGIRWAFISLVPWCALAFISTLFLSKIKDSDLECKEVVEEKAEEEQKEEESSAT